MAQEYGAFIPGLTGINFIDDDCDSLANVVIQMLNDLDERIKMNKIVQEIVRDQYNVDVMEERFVTIVKYAAIQN